MPLAYRLGLAWMGLVLLALALRWPGLAERPMHADEATGARIVATRLEDGAYRFDPHHFHGPLLSYVAAGLARLRGESDWSSLTQSTLRLVPLLAGVLLVLTPFLWRRQLGDLPALVAGALLATSPLLVYYSRMYIHEGLLALLALAGGAAVVRLTEVPGRMSALLAGVAIGLMAATKVTVAITLASWGAAVCLHAWSWKRHPPLPRGPDARAYLAAAPWLVGAVALTAGYFYSNDFTHPAGLLDALRSPFVYATTAGHEKGAGYYLQLLLSPKHRLGFWWTEGAVAVLALVALLKPGSEPRERAALRFVAVVTGVHLLIYSLLAYKTPWLMLVPWAYACLLAGAAFQSFGTRRRVHRLVLTGFLLLALPYQTFQSLQAAGRFASDARNPYAYVPSSNDLERLQDWLGSLAATAGTDALEPIAIVGSEFWPLPWYLRDFAQIGYWPEANPALRDCPLIFAMPAEAPAVSLLLAESHTTLPRGLRANVAVVLYLRNDLWKQWIEARP